MEYLDYDTYGLSECIQFLMYGDGQSSDYEYKTVSDMETLSHYSIILIMWF